MSMMEGPVCELPARSATNYFCYYLLK